MLFYIFFIFILFVFSYFQLHFPFFYFLLSIIYSSRFIFFIPLVPNSIIFFNILSLYLNILISFLTVLTETLQRILHKPQIYKGRVGLPVHILYIRS